jgi:branched-chain amino acid transport system substrate-binding protein
MAEVGRDHRAGYELWLELVNKAGGILGRPVELIFEDNRTNTEVAVAQYERLITVRKVDLLFATFSSLLSFPTSAVAERYRYVYPVTAGGARRIWSRGFKYVFYFQEQLAEEIIDGLFNAMAGYKIAPMPKTIGVTHVDDFFANAIAGRVPEGAKRLGMEIVHLVKFPADTTDFLSVVNPLRVKNPDVWIAPVASYQAGVDLLRAGITIGYQPKLVFMSTAPTQPEFKRDLGNAVNGVIAHAAWHPNVKWKGERVSSQEFTRLFNQKYGREPQEDNAIPFAAAQGIQYAIEKTKSVRNDVIRNFLASRTASDPVPTILGPFRWDSRGAPAGRDFLFLQWVKGNLELVWPNDPDVKTADLLYPKPRW